MDTIAARFRLRLLPALLLAVGVAVLSTGLLSYTTAAAPTPTTLALEPYDPLPTTEPGLALPSAGSGPVLMPTFPPDRVTTRVVVPRLGIDLPVIAQPSNLGVFPPCDVAEYFEDLGQPGSGRATYLYAHAARGMFLPLLTASRINDGQKMIGMTVEVYTSDNMLFLYRVVQVMRHQTSIAPAYADDVGYLWLQTCEGPTLDTPKVFVIGALVSAGPASASAANPHAHPRQCM
jgi:hypothetical protein